MCGPPSWGRKLDKAPQEEKTAGKRGRDKRAGRCQAVRLDRNWKVQKRQKKGEKKKLGRRKCTGKKNFSDPREPPMVCGLNNRSQKEGHGKKPTIGEKGRSRPAERKGPGRRKILISKKRGRHPGMRRDKRQSHAAKKEE